MNKNENNNNGFFNKNPILIFAIFAIVIVVLFRSFSDSEFGSDMISANTQTKNLAYSDFKDYIKKGQISQVAIAETTIKAVGVDHSVYMIKRVNDPTLVPALEEAKVQYTAFSERNWLSDLLFSWVLPVFIFFGIWMFLASRMQKNMGGGLLGVGSALSLIHI